jgi:hypothetical protein
MASPPDGHERRWALIRDAVVFSAKVGIEALRDVLLIPLGLGSAALGLLLQPEDPGRYFRRVLALGERFDRYLNLFGAVGGSEPRVDALFERLETILVDQHKRGGITVGAKDAIDRTLDALQRAVPATAPRERSDRP